MSEKMLSIIYGLRSVTASDIWGVIAGKPDIISGPIRLNDEEASIEKITEFVEKYTNDRFRIRTNKFNFILSPVANYDHTLLTIETNSVNVDWRDWVLGFYDLKPFVQAWVSNVEYSYWQNAYDPLQYSAANKSYAGLPMKSNNLPYPLEQKIIDTSNNPGRRTLQAGYVEVVDSNMWFGASFWKISQREKLRILRGLSKMSVVADDNNGLLNIQVQAEPFTSASDVAVQNKLREIIYIKNV